MPRFDLGADAYKIADVIPATELGCVDHDEGRTYSSPGRADLLTFPIGATLLSLALWSPQGGASCVRGLVADAAVLAEIKYAFETNDDVHHWRPNFPAAQLAPFELSVTFDDDREREAIETYLRGSHVNLALRGHHDTFFRTVDPAPFAEMIAHLDTALTRLSVHTGVAFRGASVPSSELAVMRPGHVSRDPGFLSASLDVKRARRFEARFVGLRSVLFVIASATGRVVPAEFYHRREWEILFPRDSVWTVLDIDGSDEDQVVVYVRDDAR